ncbi:type II toxin-antitoxin system HigB family toxin [Lentisphaera profundi]|uniref:Type II toxin-antitoxin system HigB family toxin n=1 Tax=Lentisphaera profundi TaxID=1658616 RepID=A0ABY7VZ93_9BACT|nr:type II toxin-antitoxin system HigB family toxin [Lentisphaera profundi]WDE98530.1 type II toxin-antitoxin system HigB family toxin [Lentisphaera profundi]
MRILKRKTLEDFWLKHANAKGPLEAWFAEASKAKWIDTTNIKAKYSSASFIAGNRVVFNIGGNNYRLIVKIAYKPGIVFIRFIGSHAEYDKIDAETI